MKKRSCNALQCNVPCSLEPCATLEPMLSPVGFACAPLWLSCVVFSWLQWSSLPVGGCNSQGLVPVLLRFLSEATRNLLLGSVSSRMRCLPSVCWGCSHTNRQGAFAVLPPQRLPLVGGADSQIRCLPSFCLMGLQLH